jgi:hypothetical protein
VSATVQPALLTGPYDWNPAHISLAEFHTRLQAARSIAAGQGADLLLVHGDRAAFGALAYLTGFVPKLGPALAFIPPIGDISLLFSGGPGMVGSAEKLTWVSQLRALGPPARDLAPLAGLRVALWGIESLSFALHGEILAAIGPAGRLIPLDRELDALRRRKSPAEQRLLRQAAAILADVAASLRADLCNGSSLERAVLAAERLGYAAGAQDVRILAARRPGGAPLPADGTAPFLPRPLHIAVRYGLYWAQAWPTATRDPTPPVTIPANLSGTGIGLDLTEAPRDGEPLFEGDVVCLRTPTGSAIVINAASGQSVIGLS